MISIMYDEIYMYCNLALTWRHLKEKEFVDASQLFVLPRRELGEELQHTFAELLPLGTNATDHWVAEQLAEYFEAIQRAHYTALLGRCRFNLLQTHSMFGE